jgi:hypothetical protein
LPVPSTAILAYVLGSMATGGTVIFHEFLDSSASRRRHGKANTSRQT